MDYPTSPPVPSSDPLIRDRVVTQALAARGDYVPYGLSLLSGLLLSARLCFPERLGWPIDLQLGSKAMLFALPIGVLPLVLMLLFVGVVLTPMRRALELQWLSGLAIPFPHRGYLLALKRESSTNHLQFLLTFDHEPKQDEVEQLFNIRLPSSKLIWQDERCVMVRSPPGLETKTSGSKFGGQYANANLHRWFRRVASPFFTGLHRNGGLKKVELRA